MGQALHWSSFHKYDLIHPHQQPHEKILWFPFCRCGNWTSNMFNYSPQAVRRPKMWMIIYAGDREPLESRLWAYPAPLFGQEIPSPLLCEMTAACSSGIHFFLYGFRFVQPVLFVSLWNADSGAAVAVSSSPLPHMGFSSTEPHMKAASLTGFQGLTVTTVCPRALSMWSQKLPNHLLAFRIFKAWYEGRCFLNSQRSAVVFFFFFPYGPISNYLHSTWANLWRFFVVKGKNLVTLCLH